MPYIIPFCVIGVGDVKATNKCRAILSINVDRVQHSLHVPHTSKWLWPPHLPHKTDMILTFNIYWSADAYMRQKQGSPLGDNAFTSYIY